VFHRVGQRFGCDVVCGDLDGLGEPGGGGDVQVDGQGAAAGQRAQGRAQASNATSIGS
jgi:hypothetical protein